MAGWTMQMGGEGGTTPFWTDSAGNTSMIDPGAGAAAYSGAGANSNLFGGANDFSNTAFYGVPGSVGKMLTDAANRAGVSNYDFNTAAWKAAPGYGWQLPGANGWQLGANEEQIYRNILQNTDDPRLQALANERSDASYQTGAQAGQQRDVELAQRNAASGSGLGDLAKLALLAGGIYGGASLLGLGGLGAGAGGAFGATEGLGMAGSYADLAAAGGLGGGAAGLGGFAAEGGATTFPVPDLGQPLLVASEGAPGVANVAGLPSLQAYDAARLASMSSNLFPGEGGIPAIPGEAPVSLAASAAPAFGSATTNAGMDELAQAASGVKTGAQPSLLSSLMSRVSSAFGGGTGGGGSASGVGLGSLASLLSIGSGIYGLTQAQKLRKLVEAQANKADPWGASGGRDVAGGQLKDLLTNPNKITDMPGYEAGLQAVQRSMAANGYLGSGNMMTALAKYGGDFYNNAVAQLSGLAGANVNPGTAAGYVINGATSANDLASRSLASIGYGATGNNQNLTNLILQRVLGGGAVA